MRFLETCVNVCFVCQMGETISEDHESYLEGLRFSTLIYSCISGKP